MKKLVQEGDQLVLRDGVVYMPFTMEEAQALQVALNGQIGHAPPPVTGYRTLNPDQLALMNEIKTVGRDVLTPLIDKVRAQAGQDPAESARWAALGRTHIQEGLMALSRAVAKPEFL